MGKQREKDPVTGIDLNRLTNYNNSEPIDYRSDINLGNLRTPGAPVRQGSSGDVNLYDYEASRYDTNIQPYELGGLEGIRAQNQGIFDSLARSTGNLIGKTAVNVVGGLTGLAYGASEAIQSGNVSDLWDNDLTTTLDKASESIGDYFRVYKSNDFEGQNLIERAVLHPIQFTDSVMDTLSFTTGAVLTEMISGGIASGIVIPRALKYFKSLNKAADAGRVGSELSATSNALLQGLGNAGNLGRQLATGAAYEASIEARHANMELRDNLHNQWLEENPGLSLEDMPEDVRNNIDDRLSNAGLFTFLSNMALVGSSNIMQFPKVFGAGYNTSKRAQDLSNRITRNAGGVFEDVATNASRGQRLAGNVATALRNPFYEGIVEEGGQGVISGLSNSYFARKFDEDSNANVTNFIQDFARSLADTYTTAEGWEEIGMGMIIGSLGAPGRGILAPLGQSSSLGQIAFNEDGSRRELWDGGIAGAFRERAEQTAQIAEYIEELNQNTSLLDSMRANYDFLVQSDSLDNSMSVALQNEDIFNYNNFKDDKVHAYITSRLKSGLASDLDTTVEHLNRMSPDELYAEFRGQEEADQASDETKREFKSSAINEFKEKVKATTDAFNIVDQAYTGDNAEIREYFAHSIAGAKYTDIREKAMYSQLSDLSNGAINNLNIRGTDTSTVGAEIDRLNDLVNDPNIPAESKESIRSVIQSLDNVENKERALTITEYDSLNRMAETDPVTLSLNVNKITELLHDSRRLRQRRQGFINDYNDLFTEDGVRNVQRKQREFMREQERVKQEQEEEAARAEAEQTRLDDELRTQNRKAEIKAQKEAADVQKNQLAEEEVEVPEAETTPEVVAEEADAEDDLFNFQSAALLDDDGNVVSTETPTEEVTQEPVIETSEIDPDSSEVKSIITNIEQEDSYNENQLIKQDGLVRNPLEDTNQYDFIDLTFKRDTGNTLISLNIEYSENILGDVETSSDQRRIFSNYNEEGKLEINQNFDSRLQSPSQFNTGTEVNIIVPTYAQMQDNNYDLTGYPESEYAANVDNLEMFPIAFTDNTGKIIGYLPTVANVRDRVAPDFVETEVIANRNLREEIFNNRNSNIRATITDKSRGTPMFQTNKTTIYDALGDGNRLADNVSIGVFKEGKMQIGQGNTFQNAIKLPDNTTADDYFNEGYVYAIVPTAKEGEHFAFSTDVNTIGESGANSIIKMLELYKATDPQLVAERENLALEVDFENFQDTISAIESLIYINNDNDNYIFRLDPTKLILGITPDMQFTWNSFKNQSTKDRVRDILASRYHAVRLANFGNPFNSFELSDNNELNIVRNQNYNDYLNNNNVISTNIQSEPVTGTANERYFTAQSVISIGNVSIEGQISPSEGTSASDTGVSTSEEISDVTASENALGIDLDIDDYGDYFNDVYEDFTEITNSDLTLDQQTELLMKKCQ